MTVEVAPQIRARWEVWRSFEACVRSYAAVEGLSDTETPKVSSFGDHIDVTWHGVCLGFTMDPENGTTAWIIQWGKESMWGGFRVLPEGSFEMSDSRKDIDHAAIDFLALLRKQIAAGRGTSSLSPKAEVTGEVLGRIQ